MLHQNVRKTDALHDKLYILPPISLKRDITNKNLPSMDSPYRYVGIRYASNIGMSKQPMIGQLMMVRGVQCKIVKILPFGTLDVVSICGQYAYRVSGLAFV